MHENKEVHMYLKKKNPALLTLLLQVYIQLVMLKHLTELRKRSFSVYVLDNRRNLKHLIEEKHVPGLTHQSPTTKVPKSKLQTLDYNTYAARLFCLI